MALLLALLASGCAQLAPSLKPYEMDLVTDPVMTGRDPLTSETLRRVHECTEAARGGTLDTWSGQGCH